jgi:capsular polysaccharide biosynthesis protein
MQDQNTRFIYMSYEHVSPVFAHNLINLLLVELNEVTRVSAIEASSNSLAYLYDELAKTNEKDVRSTINDMIRNQLNIQMLTNVNNDFLLTPIDPAYIPENKSSPQRSLICILGTIFGLFISILITLIKHYLHKENTTHQLK